MPDFFIKTITGKTYKYEINDNIKISDFKLLLEKDIGSYVRMKCLAYNGKILKDDDYINADLNSIGKKNILLLLNKFNGA